MTAPTAHYVFVSPPGWPVRDVGWVPPEGFVPDPGWPLPPAGWVWWVLVPGVPVPPVALVIQPAPQMPVDGSVPFEFGAPVAAPVAVPFPDISTVDGFERQPGGQGQGRGGIAHFLGRFVGGFFSGWQVRGPLGTVRMRSGFGGPSGGGFPPTFMPGQRMNGPMHGGPAVVTVRGRAGKFLALSVFVLFIGLFIYLAIFGKGTVRYSTSYGSSRYTSTASYAFNEWRRSGGSAAVGMLRSSSALVTNAVATPGSALLQPACSKLEQAVANGQQFQILPDTRRQSLWMDSLASSSAAAAACSRYVGTANVADMRLVVTNLDVAAQRLRDAGL